MIESPARETELRQCARQQGLRLRRVGGEAGGYFVTHKREVVFPMNFARWREGAALDDVTAFVAGGGARGGIA